MFTWFTSLERTERKTLYACFGGWAVDALDTQLYSFLVPTLIAAWSMSNAQAGLLGTSALISSAVGGWAAGILSDRIGRVRVMTLAIAWFAVFTVLSGFANSFEELLVARILSGIGFGGEWAAGSVLMGEVIRAQYRGKAVGTVQSAYAVGYAFAALLSSLLFATLPDTQAWRWMFWLGALPAVFILLALRGIPEPKVFLVARAARAKAGQTHVSPLTIFHPRYLRTTVLTSLLALGVQAGGFSMGIWLPTFLKTVREISTVAVGYHMFVLTIGSFVGYIVAAYLSDAIGRRGNFLLFALLNWIFIPAYLYVPGGMAILFGLDFVLGFAILGIYAALGPYFTELFPNAIRGSGQGFSYNFGRAAGAFFPTVVGLISGSGHLPLRDAMALIAVSAYFFVLFAIALLPETNGRDLSETDEASDPTNASETAGGTLRLATGSGSHAGG
ncbi:MFS transporter [Bradyrhizobium prioriisuperbiae]|uniref:MFS transporter n=1 Tax=Bradyrhizobium prioriisuperbiae TaxID=2854389 RepID=UPI0028EEFE5E|nr:MFS transporter [Bradyrhizobium prioritasuperba]